MHQDKCPMYSLEATEAKGSDSYKIVVGLSWQFTFRTPPSRAWGGKLIFDHKKYTRYEANYILT